MKTTDRRIGIVGGGQLGKMMILEAKRLGFYIAVLDPAADCPAHSISDVHITAEFSDPDGYIQLAETVGKDGVITYEFEHINANALEALEKKGYTVYPSVKSLKTIQNKFTQKTALRERDIPVPLFEQVSGVGDICKAGEKFGYPMMLKTVTGGYDGKGNAIIRSESEIETAYNRLTPENGEPQLMAEKFVDFSMEVSVIVCSGTDNNGAVYPVAENIHRDSILDMTVVPARIGKRETDGILAIAYNVMDVFDGIGTFCVELFISKNGEIYVNEVAPRPHNSGHYTIEGCFANQFENHIRAITGLPLGNTDLIQPTVMVNLLGEGDGPANIEGLEEAYKTDGRLHVHIYGKSECKIGRKMGHFTVVGGEPEQTVKRAEKIKQIIRFK